MTESLNQIVSRFRRLEQQARQFGYGWLTDERNRVYEELTDELSLQRQQLQEAMADLAELYTHECEFDASDLCIFCYMARERTPR